jgi:hypothetical protein
MAGTAYIRQMYDLYGAPGFLAAYNAGPRRLEDYLWGSRGLPEETRNYVARVGPRIHGTSPGRRAPPEVYAAAELPFVIPPGPRQGDQATMLALREQRRTANPATLVAQGPAIRTAPTPDGRNDAPPLVSLGAVTPPAPQVQIASAGPVVRMEPVVSPGDPGTIRAETLAPPSGTRQQPVAARMAGFRRDRLRAKQVQHREQHEPRRPGEQRLRIDRQLAVDGQQQRPTLAHGPQENLTTDHQGLFVGQHQAFARTRSRDAGR